MEERDRIAHRHHRGCLQKEIAAALGRDKSTISRELRRNRVNEEYFAGQAQALAQQRRRERPLQRKLDAPDVNSAVRRGLAQEWSPEQIAGDLKRRHPDEPGRRVSAPTIYAWIERDEHRDHWKSFLRRRGTRPCREQARATWPLSAGSLAHQIQLAAAVAGGVFRERACIGGGCGWRLRCGLRRCGLLPKPSAVGVAVGSLGVLFGVADAGGVFGPAGGIRCPCLIRRVARELVGLSSPLRSARGRQAADDAE
jgi:transcriptional regulator with XRE-family HTH domain